MIWGSILLTIVQCLKTINSLAKLMTKIIQLSVRSLVTSKAIKSYDKTIRECLPSQMMTPMVINHLTMECRSNYRTSSPQVQSSLQYQIHKIFTHPKTNLLRRVVLKKIVQHQLSIKKVRNISIMAAHLTSKLSRRVFQTIWKLISLLWNQKTLDQV